MSAPIPNYAHNAKFISAEEVHDGDSFGLLLDLGRLSAGVTLQFPIYVRLFGADAWELSQPKGIIAREFTRTALAGATKIVVQTIKPDGSSVGVDKYGRFLARVWVDDKELSEMLAVAGLLKTP